MVEMTLDRVREQISYLKYWQGIMVVTDISLVGWLMTLTDFPSPRNSVLGLVAILALTMGIMLLHRHIWRLIDATGTL
jgi:hypothetical protein